MFKASKAARFVFFNASVILFIAIGLTGYDKVHWLSYLVPSVMLFAAITGLCPGLIFGNKLFRE